MMRTLRVFQSWYSNNVLLEALALFVALVVAMETAALGLTWVSLSLLAR